MAPSTRSSSLKFEQATDGGWRIIEGGNTRRLTTEELNEYAKMFATTRHENETLEMERAELEATMAQKEQQYCEDLQEKERALEAIATSSKEELDLKDNRQGIEAEHPRPTQGILPKAVGPIDLEGLIATKLSPMEDMLSRLTEQVATLVSGGGSVEISERLLGSTGNFSRNKNEHSRSDVEGWGGMRIREANRLYRDNMTPVVVSKAGDSKFAAAKACWDRLCGQFPVSKIHEAKLVAHAFTGQAAAVYQQVAAANPTATAEELWAAMERRLHNPAQVQSQRGKFYEARMKRGESVEEFAERLRELACGLPESIDDCVLQQRLIAGLPDYLKVPAATASTDFDTAVTQLELVMEAMSSSTIRRRHGVAEQVNEVLEGERDGFRFNAASQRGSVSWTGRETVEETRDRSKPAGSRENPVGFDPKKPEEVTPWNWSRRCFKCNQFGHIRVGATQERQWPEATVVAVSGNGKGGLTPVTRR
jgi:hypothetical protein